MASPVLNTVTTSYLLENLHCPTCVAFIRALLLEHYSQYIIWVSPNIITSVLTVEHQDVDFDIFAAMKNSLELAGFKVSDVMTNATFSASETLSFDYNESFDVSGNRWVSAAHFPRREAVLSSAHQTHLEHCSACRKDVGENGFSITSNYDGQHDEQRQHARKQIHPDKLVHSKSLPLDHDKTQATDDRKESSHPRSWRTAISISGMTCAVCANTITAHIDSFPWVSTVSVNLVTNSATVECSEYSRIKELVEAIEDLGYDAVLDTIVEVGSEFVPTDEREVEIWIDGIFCQRCPKRIEKTIESFVPHTINIISTPSMQRPILKVRYRPLPPSFTIRHILGAIEAADPSLRPQVYNPPTIEEKSKGIQRNHQRQLLWRLVMTFIISVPTFIFGIVYMSLVPHSDPTKSHLMKPWTNGISRLDVILCVLATPVWLLAADIFHRRAIKEVRVMWRAGSPTPILKRFYMFGSMNMLMSLGTTIAYISSVCQMVATAVVKEKALSPDELYFDSVVFLTLFLLAGRWIEAISKSKTGNAVDALVKLRPQTALLVVEGAATQTQLSKVSIDQLEAGDHIRVPAGASPAVDGQLVEGDASFDESSLTGESRLVKKQVGDEVFSGTINKTSTITVRVTNIIGDSMLDKIVQVVREGQAKRAPIEQVADLLTTYFVPMITLIAIITWVTWTVLSFSGAVSDQASRSSNEHIAFAFRFAIAVFVVACPCGLALAAPTAIFVGIGLAAKNGLLVKGGGEAFETASRIDCVVFDKTGTLTSGGDPKVTDWEILPSDGKEIEKRTFFSLLASVEENSSHPIAKAVVEFCASDRASLDLQDIEEIAGRGMRAKCESLGLDVVVGNEALLRDLGLSVPMLVAPKLLSWKREAKSIALVAMKFHGDDGWQLAAALAIADPIRPEAAYVVKSLRSRGIQVWMLSGDNIDTAQAVAAQVGIKASNVLAEVLPTEKAAKVTYLQSTLKASAGDGNEHVTKRAVVAMVGDGINDSPALTSADVGIAIGSGSDVAISSASFVLASSNLGGVLTLLDLSRFVFQRIKVNFGWAIVYNVVAVPIAAGCLYSVQTSNGSRVTLDPVWASLAMALSSISVVLSSLSMRAGIPWVRFRASAVGEEVL